MQEQPRCTEKALSVHLDAQPVPVEFAPRTTARHAALDDDTVARYGKAFPIASMPLAPRERARQHTDFEHRIRKHGPCSHSREHRREAQAHAGERRENLPTLPPSEGSVATRDHAVFKT